MEWQISFLEAEQVVVYAKDFGFFETVSANRGIRLAIFLERESALRWLMEP